MITLYYNVGCLHALTLLIEFFGITTTPSLSPENEFCMTKTSLSRVDDSISENTQISKPPILNQLVEASIMYIETAIELLRKKSGGVVEAYTYRNQLNELIHNFRTLILSFAKLLDDCEVEQEKHPDTYCEIGRSGLMFKPSGTLCLYRVARETGSILMSIQVR